MDTQTPGAARVRASILPLTTLAVLVLGGCGGGGENLPSPTRTLPSASVSGPSRSPSSEVPETATPSEAPSESPRPTLTPRPTKSVIVTRTETPTPTETETPSASAAPAPTEPAEGGLPVWLWWLLAVLLAGLVAYLILRARRRSAWDAEAAKAEVEVGWLARDLLPQLQQSRTSDALAGGWQVSAVRARAVEDRLTGLETSAPDESRASRARALRDAVRAARADVESQISSGDQAFTPAVLAASIARLQELLNPHPPTA